MSVSTERSANRASSRGRSASGGSGKSPSGSSRPTRSRAGNDSARQASSNHDGARGTISNIGIGVLGASLGVAGGVLLGRTALQRNRKVLGIPVPNKIDLAGVSRQISEASRQVGTLAGEVRTMREKAEQVGRILS